MASPDCRPGADKTGSSKCWNCKKRRLKCDGTIPHCDKCRKNGVQCLGYQKPLTWVAGVARRGPMKNRSFGDDVQPLGRRSGAVSRQASVSSDETPPQDADSLSTTPNSLESFGSSPESLAVLDNNWELSPLARYAPEISKTLTEPVFQGLDYNSRFFIDYFSQRLCPLVVLRDNGENQYRGVIALVGSCPAVAHAMVAVASVHLENSLTGIPTPSSLTPRQQLAALSPAEHPSTTGFQISKPSLLRQRIICKQKAFNMLSAALVDPVQSRDYSTFATVLILTMLDLYEGGSGAWSIHLEGAKKLLALNPENGRLAQQSGLSQFIGDMSMFETFGGSFSRNRVCTRSIRSQFLPTMHEAGRVVLATGCPLELLLALEVFASQRQLNAICTRLATDGVDVEMLEAALTQVDEFDIDTWAAHIALGQPHDTLIIHHNLIHLGYIWKDTAKIYGCQVLRSLGVSVSQSPSVDELIQKYAFLDGDDDELFKCLIWPTFIAGAASTTLQQREWAARTFTSIWNVTLTGNCTNASMVLVRLWERQDRWRMAGGCEEQWDWMTELTLLDEGWCFV